MKNRTFDLSLYGGGLYTIDGDSTAVPNECSQAYPAGGNNAHYCNADVDAAFASGRHDDGRHGAQPGLSEGGAHHQ